MSRAETEKNIETRKEFLNNSIEIYKGPYLHGIDADWVVADRKKYLDLYLDALQRLAGLYFSEKDYDSALEISQKAIQSDNCFENAYRLEMQAYHAMGNKAEVVRTYKKFCKILFAEIGAEPSVQTQVFYKNLMK
jgi:two-component SAPR family response regulator